MIDGLLPALVLGLITFLLTRVIWLIAQWRREGTIRRLIDKGGDAAAVLALPLVPSSRWPLPAQAAFAVGAGAGCIAAAFSDSANRESWLALGLLPLGVGLALFVYLLVSGRGRTAKKRNDQSDPPLA